MPNRCGLMHVRPAEEEAVLPPPAQLDSFWADVQLKLAQFTTLPSKVPTKQPSFLQVVGARC
jgi:hypothetical protein